MEQVIGMLLAGLPQRYVGCHFNVSHTVVGRVWQSYLDTCSLVERQEMVDQGRQRPLPTVILSALLNVGGLNQRNRLMLTSETRLEFVSKQTLQRPAVRPPLTPEHIFLNARLKNGTYYGNTFRVVWRVASTGFPLSKSKRFHPVFVKAAVYTGTPYHPIHWLHSDFFT